MTPIYRSKDRELVGYTSQTSKGFEALSPFHCPLAFFDEEYEAEEWLLEHGLGMLARPWKLYVADERRWYAVHIEEAGPDWVSVRITDIRSSLNGTIVHLQHPQIGYLQAPAP